MSLMSFTDLTDNMNTTTTAMGRVPLLKGANFAEWDARLMAYLEYKGHHRALLVSAAELRAPEGVKLDEHAQATQEAKLAEWIECNRHAKFAMTSSIDFAILSTLPEAVTKGSANRLREHLRSMYAMANPTAIAYMWKELRAKQQGATPFAEHLVAMHAVRARLVQAGEKVKDGDFVAALLDSLSPEWGHTVTMVRVMLLGSPNVGGVEVEQFLHTVALTNPPTAKSALLAPAAAGAGAGRGGGGRKPMECFRCERPGHPWTRCDGKACERWATHWANPESPSYRPSTRDRADRGRGGTKAATPTESSANIAASCSSSHAQVAVPQAGGHGGVDWYVDSGATDHYCRNRGAFATYEALTHPHPISCANGAVMHALGRGDVQLRVHDALGVPTILTVHGALHVPDITTNLISITQLLRQGATVDFAPGGCTITEAGGGTVCAPASNGLFRIPAALLVAAPAPVPVGGVGAPAVPADDVGTTIAPAALLTGSEKVGALWHSRLGHVHHSTIKDMVQHALVDGLPKDAATLAHPTDHPCPTCAMGKQVRQPHRPVHHPDLDVLDTVHMDVCGPLAVPTQGGDARYFLTITDEASRYVHVVLLTHKHQVADAFARFHGRACTQTGNVKQWG